MRENRTRKLRVSLKTKHGSVFWLPNHEKSGQPATFYLSGFSGSDSHLIVAKNKTYLLTDGRYLTVAKKEAAGCVIVDVAKQSASEIIGKILRKTLSKTVLIDGCVTTFSLVEKIKEKIPNAEIINADGILKELRRVKDAAEIKLLRKASTISCMAFEKFLPLVKIGLTEKHLARALKNLLFECGADNVAFDPIVASGKNSALPHANPSDKKIKSGELVVIDFGASYKGYVSDLTRTVAVGKISPELRAMHEAVRVAQIIGCKTARSGITGHDVDFACRQSLAKFGFEKYFIHATGHGIGLEVHELPVISLKQSHLLEVGEVITCEPGVYVKELGGVRIEDSLIVTKTGAENLTKKITTDLIAL